MKPSIFNINSMKKHPLEDLSTTDQLLFQQYGQGPLETPGFRLIHQAIEDKVKNYPNATAIEHLGNSITYKQLNKNANLLALQLKLNGVAPGDNVGLFTQRSISMVTGLLAILKVGAAFVPQDARITPTPQLEHIINSANIKIVLTTTNLKASIPSNHCNKIIDIDHFIMSNKHLKSHTPPPVHNDKSICFILFTSGTTGKPNGVKVTHSNVCNILLTSPGDLNMKPGLKVAQILNISFDMAMWEILGSLSHGCTLIIRGKSIQETAEKSDIIIGTPSILGSLNTGKLRHILTAAVAGEPCPKLLAETWAQFCTFYNSCGPTEVTIINTMKRYTPSDGHLNIGKPTPNNTIYILDENQNPCPIGSIGEIWAGGECVTAGYLNNKDLTHERYKRDPFLNNGKPMFRTRDLGRWNEHGEVEHFGRTDDQVKIRGFRIELDSVSSALESFDFCKQAVTLKLDSRNLVSFVLSESIRLDQIEGKLKATLPYYSIPAFIIQVDKFPITSRGKIDKRKLTVIAVNLIEKQNITKQVPVFIGATA